MLDFINITIRLRSSLSFPRCIIVSFNSPLAGLVFMIPALPRGGRQPEPGLSSPHQLSNFPEEKDDAEGFSSVHTSIHLCVSNLIRPYSMLSTSSEYDRSERPTSSGLRFCRVEKPVCRRRLALKLLARETGPDWSSTVLPHG